MSLVIGAMTIGFVLALLALGVYISFRIFEFPDISAECSITLGAAVSAVLLTHGWTPVAATLLGAAAGGVAGGAALAAPGACASACSRARSFSPAPRQCS